VVVVVVVVTLVAAVFEIFWNMYSNCKVWQDNAPSSSVAMQCNRQRPDVLTLLFLHFYTSLAVPVYFSVILIDKEWPCRVLSGQCRPITVEAQVWSQASYFGSKGWWERFLQEYFDIILIVTIHRCSIFVHSCIHFFVHQFLYSVITDTDLTVDNFDKEHA
jgi:hypothetical protein